MFRLTSAQFERIEDSLTESTQRRVLWAAAKRWKQALDELLPQFAGTVAEAQALGFATDAEIGSYLDLVREHGDDFHRQPWAAPFFTKIPVDHPTGTLMYLQALAAQGA